MRIKLTGIKHEILRQKKGIVKIHRYSNRSVDGGYVIKNGISFFVMDDPKVPYNNRVHPMHPMHPFAAIKMSPYNTRTTTGKCAAVPWLCVGTLLSDGAEIGLNSRENLSNWRL